MFDAMMISKNIYTYAREFQVLLSWYLLGLGSVAQVLYQNKSFSKSLTHLDLSGNAGCLATEDAVVRNSEIEVKGICTNSQMTCISWYINLKYFALFMGLYKSC